MTRAQFERWIFPTMTKLNALCDKHGLAAVIFVAHGSKKDISVGFPDGVRGAILVRHPDSGNMPKFMKEAVAELTYRRRRKKRK